jgi:hypothetical protein
MALDTARLATELDSIIADLPAVVAFGSITFSAAVTQGTVGSDIEEGGFLPSRDIAISIMSLMDRDDDVANCPPQEFMDQLWAATVAIIEDPHLLDVLQTSRSTVTWHGLSRQGSMEFSRQDRHAVRTYRFNVHVSRLV